MQKENKLMQDEEKSANRIDWYSLSIEEVIGKLQGNHNGLSEQEAARRIEKYGPNRLSTFKTRGPIRRLLAQVHNLLIYVLLGAAMVTALLGHWIDTYVIIAVVVVNVVIGFVQEGKAEKALD